MSGQQTLNFLNAVDKQQHNDEKAMAIKMAIHLVGPRWNNPVQAGWGIFYNCDMLHVVQRVTVRFTSILKTFFALLVSLPLDEKDFLTILLSCMAFPPTLSSEQRNLVEKTAKALVTEMHQPKDGATTTRPTTQTVLPNRPGADDVIMVTGFPGAALRLHGLADIKARPTSIPDSPGARGSFASRAR